MKNPFIRWSLMLVIGLGLGLTINYFKTQKDLDGGVIELSPDDQGNVTILKQPESTPQEGVAGGEAIGGAFSLIDQNGKAVTEKDYAQTYKLVFFGFTHCPAVCPTELQKMTLVMNNLGEEASKFTPIFITVDPERDTPEKIKSYLSNFHPKMAGLSGSAEQIEAVKDSFRVYSKKIEAEFMDGYMVDHSAFTYLMDKDNKLVAIYPSSDTAQIISDDLKKRGL